jgi:uncharacterized protein YbjT (DUF2867 family)
VKEKPMTSPVLVTGGTGRLGRSVVARLVDAGREVRVLARHQRDTQPQVTFYPGDLRQGIGIDTAVQGAGVIINCATNCLENSRKLAKFPLVAPVPAGFRVQPVDSGEVAARLVELALDAPAGRAPDMSGPEVSSWEDLFRGYLTATHQRKWVVPVPVPGSKAVRNGALLPPPGHTEGVRTWDQLLAEETMMPQAGERSGKLGT